MSLLRKYSKNIVVLGFVIAFLIFNITTSFKYSSSYMKVAKMNSTLLYRGAEIFKAYLLSPFLGSFVDFGFDELFNQKKPVNPVNKKEHRDDRGLIERIFDIVSMILLVDLRVILMITVIFAGLLYLKKQNLSKTVKSALKIRLHRMKFSRCNFLEKLLMYLCYVFTESEYKLNIYCIKGPCYINTGFLVYKELS